MAKFIIEIEKCNDGWFYDLMLEQTFLCRDYFNSPNDAEIDADALAENIKRTGANVEIRKKY
jgi:hypothetical protein